MSKFYYAEDKIQFKANKIDKGRSKLILFVDILC